MTTYSTKNTATTSYQSSTTSNVWFCIRESLKRRTNSQHGVVLARFFNCWTRMAQDGWTCQILVLMGVTVGPKRPWCWRDHFALRYHNNEQIPISSENLQDPPRFGFLLLASSGLCLKKIGAFDELLQGKSWWVYAVHVSYPNTKPRWSGSQVLYI